MYQLRSFLVIFHARTLELPLNFCLFPGSTVPLAHLNGMLALEKARSDSHVRKEENKTEQNVENSR